MPVNLQCFYVPFKTGVIKNKYVTLHPCVLMRHIVSSQQRPIILASYFVPPVLLSPLIAVLVSNR